jgi:hypothetical protein
MTSPQIWQGKDGFLLSGYLVSLLRENLQKTLGSRYNSQSTFVFDEKKQALVLCAANGMNEPNL